MSASAPLVLTVNGGSSSIKFALFEACSPMLRALEGDMDRIGAAEGIFRVKGLDPADDFMHAAAMPDHAAAVAGLMDWIEKRGPSQAPSAIGHRVVHGGPDYSAPQRVTPGLISALRRLSPFDPEHLPEEIMLAEAFHKRFPSIPQVACFDTAFHLGLPRVASLLPIPRRFEALGVRRYGFHGLSYSYLIEELGRRAGLAAAQGKVILAHLGNGASLAAVRDGRSIDTSMGFTPAAGMPMSTRSGDIDPGLPRYLAQLEGMDASQFNAMANFKSGLLGMSETSSDMRDLLACEADDARAAEAVAVFCYQLKKWVGAMAAALGGLDSLVFAGGIGEHSPKVRARACAGLEFLGIELDERGNGLGAGIISTPDSRVAVHVIHTDESLMIARAVCQVLRLGAPGMS